MPLDKSANGQATFLSVEDLRVHFDVSGGGLFAKKRVVKAVDDVSFALPQGQTLGVVGESGSGKSTLARAIMRLVPITGGHANIDGNDVATMPDADMQAMRKRMQMIFQDPLASLSPRMTVSQIIGEPLLIHRRELGAKGRKARVLDVMEQVGLRPEMYNRYPHEFSGGQAQRIGIARAMALDPEMIVADEPVSALDVSIQSQVINLLTDLQQQKNLTMLFISHDLSIVRHIADQVLVLYLGKVMEFGPVRQVYAAPKHPYTKALISAIPTSDKSKQRQRIILKGDIPSPINPPKGCVFSTRCPHATDLCRTTVPVTEDVEGVSVACHRWREVG